MHMAVFTKEKWMTLLFESGLIIFSVMLALFLDEYRVNLKQEKATQKALSNLKQEMKANLSVIEKWQKYHSQVYTNIDKVLKSAEINEAEFVKDEAVHFYSVMPNGVVQELIDDSAWQAFRNSGYFSNLDFEDTITISRVYNLQNSGVMNTLQIIFDRFSSAEFLERAKLRRNLIILRSAFQELASQEVYLIEKYNQALKQLDEKSH